MCRALGYPSPGYRAGSGVMLLERSDLWSLGDCTTGHQGTGRWGQVTGKGQWGQVSGVRFWRTALQSTSLGGLVKSGYLLADHRHACMQVTREPPGESLAKATYDTLSLFIRNRYKETSS